MHEVTDNHIQSWIGGKVFFNYFRSERRQKNENEISYVEREVRREMEKMIICSVQEKEEKCEIERSKSGYRKGRGSGASILNKVICLIKEK